MFMFNVFCVLCCLVCGSDLFDNQMQTEHLDQSVIKKALEKFPTVCNETQIIVMTEEK